MFYWVVKRGHAVSSFHLFGLSLSVCATSVRQTLQSKSDSGQNTRDCQYEEHSHVWVRLPYSASSLSGKRRGMELLISRFCRQIKRKPCTWMWVDALLCLPAQRGVHLNAWRSNRMSDKVFRWLWNSSSCQKWRLLFASEELQIAPEGRRSVSASVSTRCVLGFSNLTLRDTNLYLYVINPQTSVFPLVLFVFHLQWKWTPEDRGAFVKTRPAPPQRHLMDKNTGEITSMGMSEQYWWLYSSWDVTEFNALENERISSLSIILVWVIMRGHTAREMQALESRWSHFWLSLDNNNESMRAWESFRCVLLPFISSVFLCFVWSLAPFPKCFSRVSLAVSGFPAFQLHLWRQRDCL